MITLMKQTKKSKAKPKIPVTSDMLIGDIISKYPESAEIMMKYGLHCIGCHIAAWESLGIGASSHGLNEKQISKMVAEINKAIAKKKR